MLRTTLVPVLASFALFACGGSVEKVPDPNGSTSPSTPTGGSSSGASTGSGGSRTGGSATGSEEEAQCDGIPECNEGWTEVKGCVPDSECEKKTTCGVTIICQKIEPTCEGPRPLCDPGDEEIEGKNACPSTASSCYSRSNNCNFTVWCAKY